MENANDDADAQELWERLVARHEDMIRAECNAAIDDSEYAPMEAEDLRQEVRIHLWEIRDQLLHRNIEHMRAYLRKCCKRCIGRIMAQNGNVPSPTVVQSR